MEEEEGSENITEKVEKKLEYKKIQSKKINMKIIKIYK